MNVTGLRLRRATRLGRSHGRTAGAAAARHAVNGAWTLLRTAGSLAILAVSVVILSAVGTLVMMVLVALWMLLFSLTSSQAEHLSLALLLFAALMLIGRFCRTLPPSGKGPFPR